MPEPQSGENASSVASWRKEVSLEARYQYARIQNGAVHDTSLSGLADESGVASSARQRLGDLVVGEVLQLGGTLGNEAITAGPKLLAVGQHVGKTKLPANRAGNVGMKLPSSMRRTTVGRLSPRISAACWVDISGSRVKM